MQSKLAATAVNFSRIVLFGPKRLFLGQRLGCATTTGRTADPALHSVEPEDVYPTEAIEDEKLRHRPENEPTGNGSDPYVPQKSPIDSAPKLESTGIGPRTNPIAQQKRRRSTENCTKIDDVSCAGIDGSPWPEEADRKAEREEQAADNKDYFKHHRASPLSEIEIADTRGMIAKASGGTAQSKTFGYEWSGGIMGWRPEQLDSAEDSLRRATEIFKWNAVRGDPDSPHGRVLRELRGEYW
ncbi:hypothetical protein ABFS82_04G010400 [Erythranthe guttata]|uniref:Uncharacterized protein n=1 Tax=Erythranthe guttata TaxID=4155 RepID=A0A022S1Y4_ERYGU|nr:hypothetical protein MIMGU_mgv1a024267mg [Erythranthe guttata]